MMTILVLAEHDNLSLSEQTSKAVHAATQIGGDIHVLVAGSAAQAVADAAAKLSGVAKVLLADAETFASGLAEPVSALLESLAGDYDVLLAPATANGKNTMPRVAALLDVMQVSDVVEVVSADTFKRPIYAGNAIQTVQSTDAKKVLTIRTAGFDAVGADGSAVIETIASSTANSVSVFVSNESSDSDMPELTSAKIVISGGRAFGSQEQFDALLEPLAKKLGAAIGASRAAVDAGYASNDLQVGQTGKIVAPDLYIAVGISGAIQHVAGMKDTKVIVAINKDEECPIFQIADYSLVADLFEALPELQNAL